MNRTWMSPLQRRAELLAWIALAAFVLIQLLRWGGGGQWTAQAAGVAALAAALAALCSLRDRARLPPAGWVLALPLPLLALGLVQLVPMGWGHPATAPDRAALGVTPGAWAVDPDAAWQAASWRLSLLVACAAAVVTLRRVDPRRLAAVLVLVAAAHALGAILLAELAPALPLDNGYRGRVRGSFTYPNHAAALWCMALPLAILWASRLGARGRPIAWLAPALLGAAVALSASRSGLIIGLVVGLPALAIALPARRRWPALGAVAAAAAAVLWLLNPSQTVDRLGDLAAGDAATVGGRVAIWEAGASLVQGAGPIGYGPGAVRLLWRSAGEPGYEPAAVHHLHQDGLELVVEFGWLGAVGVLAAAAWAAVSLWRSRGDAARWPLIGASLGMIALLALGVVDFPWRSAALVTWFFALALVAALATAPHRARAVRSTARVRIALALLAAALVAVMPGDWRRERQSVAAWWAEAAVRRQPMAGALAAGVPEPAAIAAALALGPTTAALAVIQVELYLDRLAAVGAIDAATASRVELALRCAASRTPADPRVWLQRARWARLRGDPIQAESAVAGLLRRAPAWPAAHAEILRACEAGLVGDDLARRAAERILATDVAQTGATLEQLAGILGIGGVVAALRAPASGPLLRASALAWLARRAGLEAWRATWVEVWSRRAGGPLSAELWLPLVDAFGPEAAGDRVAVPADAAHRRAAIARLQAAGLPLPPLLETLVDGRPVEPALTASALPPDAAAARAAVESLARWRNLPPVAARMADLEAYAAALDGDPSALDREVSPAVLAAVSAADGSDPAVAERAEVLLQLARVPRWRELRHGRWSWWRHDPRGAPVVVVLSRWTAIVVDGQVVTWARGTVDLRVHVAHGLHRVALLHLPP